MTSILELALDFLDANETLRNRKANAWPKEEGVSWFKFFLIWSAVEACVRWFGPLAFPAEIRDRVELNLALLLVAAPLAWLMTRQFAGVPRFREVTGGKQAVRTKAIAEGLGFGAFTFALLFPLQWIDAHVFGPQPPIPLEGAWWTLLFALGINGMWSPLFEELGWRGRLQRSLTDVYGFGWALLGTSLLFSLKHAFIDLSPGRTFTVMGIGLCLGVAYRRGGLTAAIAAHIALNVAATSLAWKA